MSELKRCPDCHSEFQATEPLGTAVGDYVERKVIQEAMNHVTQDVTCPLHIAAEIDQCLGEAPAADVVKVTRCRECKNRNHDGDGNPWCDAHMKHVPDLDFFCRDGRP